MVATRTGVVGQLRVERRLRMLRKRTRDLRGAWEQVRADFLATEEHTYGQGARPISTAYAAWKNEHYPGGGALVLTGRLRAAMTGRSSDFISRLRPSSMRLEFAVPYAWYAHFEAGVVLPAGRDELGRWTRIMDSWLARAVEG